MKTLTNSILEHKGLIHLDIGHNFLTNDEFVRLFGPVSRNKASIQRFECRGNALGGRALDNILSCVSRSLKVLDLSKNKLTEMNGEILRSYAANNVWIEAIHLTGNKKVKADSIESIKLDCQRNIQIQHFVLPRLARAEETGFKHKSIGNTCYSDYDVTELSFSGRSFHRLDFVAKFMIHNKESFEKLVLKDVRVEAGGEELTRALKGKAGNIDLKSIYLENVNLSLLGLKQVISSCAKMENLVEFSLVNMEYVKQQKIQDMLFKAFGRHKHLENLNLANNDLPNYDTMVQIL